MVKDATADYSDEFMHAAFVTNLPNYASAIVTTQEVTNAVSGSRPLAQSSSASHGTTIKVLSDLDGTPKKPNLAPTRYWASRWPSREQE